MTIMFRNIKPDPKTVFRKNPTYKLIFLEIFFEKIPKNLKFWNLL